MWTCRLSTQLKPDLLIIVLNKPNYTCWTGHNSLPPGYDPSYELTGGSLISWTSLQSDMLALFLCFITDESCVWKILILCLSTSSLTTNHERQRDHSHLQSYFRLCRNLLQNKALNAPFLCWFNMQPHASVTNLILIYLERIRQTIQQSNSCDVFNTLTPQTPLYRP